MELSSEKKTIQHSIPLDILDDLSSRFIINVPEEERQNLVRICFQIELAHWFYLDFYCTEENAVLKSCGMTEFATHIFQHIPFLKPHASKVDGVLEKWREYKQSVPTYGAILLSDDMTHVLLVQSFWAKSSWGFPKGKVNEDEDPCHCAVREVLEETGFDISNLIDKNEFIESVINDQLIRLYIICGIKMDTKFQPRTRNEIKSCEWFPLADLPSNKKDHTPKLKMGVSANAFFMAVPFVKRLKKWVFEKTQKGCQQNRRQRNKSAGDVDSISKLKPNKQAFAHLHAEIQAFEELKQKNAYLSRQKRNEKKPNFKRQLFNGNESKKTVKPTNGGTNDLEIVEDFTAPSWLNFKFNKKALLECF